MRGGSEGVQPLLRITSDTAERDGLRAPPASVGALWGENAAHRPPTDESTNQGLCPFLVCCLGSAGAHGACCLLARRPGNPCFQKGVKHISLPPGHGHRPTASPDRDSRAEKPPRCSQRPKARGVPRSLLGSSAGGRLRPGARDGGWMAVSAAGGALGTGQLAPGALGVRPQCWGRRDGRGSLRGRPSAPVRAQPRRLARRLPERRHGG